ncbi:hypothetical protein V8F33_007238 [Rhypophila sp. PSN 637]
MAPSFSVWETSFGQYIPGLQALVHILQKAEATATPELKSSLPEARLAPDMLPLKFQVQFLSNVVFKTRERLTGGKTDGFKPEGTETSLADLIVTAEKTLELAKGVTPEEVDGAADREAQIMMGKRGTITTHGRGYVFGYGIPNFYFHLSTAYAILRKEGIEIGKSDYLAPFISPFGEPVPDAAS